MDISLIVPVYNEKESLPLLQDKIRAAMDALGLTWELLYIDDGSTDGSTQVLRDLQAQADNITLAIMRRNRGKSQALHTGFALAQGAIVITMDSDLQDEPEEIKNLLARLNEGYDVVVGWKKERRDPITKRLPSWVANRATRLATGLHLHDMNSGLKAIRADVVQQINIYGDLHRYIPIIAYYEGFKVTEIAVVHHPRQFGRSKFGTGRLLRGGLDLLTVVFLNNYRYRPSHLFGAVGGVLFSLGFFINLYLTVEWFRGVRPIGDRPLLTLGVLLMVIGVQLITTGLLAELLVSYIQTREDPLSPVRQIIRPPSDDGQ
ncbi:MAG: glycosyltransferase family 2 protein [Chloroflexi bacterium]|nr:glycosyltransferase family 2 protein [Chloroflexota bacterium]